jgi:hypothetical protein
MESENSVVEWQLADGECGGGLPHAREKIWQRGRKLQPQGAFIGIGEQVVGSGPYESAMEAGVKLDRAETRCTSATPASVGVARGCGRFEADPGHCLIGPGPIC